MNRDSAPSFEFVEACFRKAVQAGVLAPVTNNRFRIKANWYAELHLLDDEAECLEYAMFEAADEISAREFEIDADVRFHFERHIYDRAYEQIESYQERLFGR